MASLITRGDRADRKFYLQWREAPGASTSTKLLVGVKTDRQAKEIAARFEVERLTGKQGTHILFELGVGKRPPDYQEIRIVDGQAVEIPAPRPKLLMGPLLRQWADSLTNHDAYEDRGRLKNHVMPYYENVPVKEAEDVSSALAYLDWLKPRLKGAQTRRHCMNLVSRFFAWAIPRKIASTNPIKQIPQGMRPQPSGKADAPWLEESLELAHLRNHLPEPVALMFYIGNRSGLRPGELAGLRMEDFHWLDEGLIRAGRSYAKGLKEDKTDEGKVKFVPAPDDALESLGPWLERRREQGAKPTDLVFPFTSVETVRAARKPSAPSRDPATKAGFIRTLPIDMAAEEVVVRAAAAGHELTREHVWVVRAQDRRAKDGKTKRFTQRLGRPRTNEWAGFTKEYLGEMWRRYRKAAMGDKKLTLYQATRHSFVSSKLAAGVPLDEVSAAVGHSSPVVTKRYYDHFIRRDFSQAIRKKSTRKVNPPAKREEPSG